MVEIFLHNVCNFDCSFCLPDTKGGDRRWQRLEHYIQLCEDIINDAGKPVWFRFTGGEPTLFPYLIDLFKFLKSKGCFITLLTNGSRTDRYWEEVANAELVDDIVFTYHPEQTSNIDHYIKIANLFVSKGVSTQVTVTCVVKYFDDAINAFNILNQKTFAVCHLQQINDSEMMLKYSESQLEVLKACTKKPSKVNIQRVLIPKDKPKLPIIEVTYSNGDKIIQSPSNLIKNSDTNFSGWECDIGIESIRIEIDTVYRGVCHIEGGKKVTNTGFFNTAPVICDRNFPCFCYSDVLEPKRMIGK